MKAKKWIYALLISLATVLCVIAAACEPAEVVIPEGTETGVYYYDAEGEEYTIQLYGGNKFYYVEGDTIKSGEYVVEDEGLSFTFNGEETAEASATVNDLVLTFTYGESEMRFLKKVNYTVAFESNEGSEVEAVSVLNGKTVTKPADPTREGYVFLGWYKDSEFTTQFAFGTEIVTADTTLYARWAEPVAGQAEYYISFDLAGGEAEAAEGQYTIGGKLYLLPVPEKAGYEFKGWWISMDGENLSYPYTEDMVFDANTTLHALWQNAEAGAKLDSPIVKVEANAISWDGVANASSYKIEISGPEGFKAVNTSTGSTSYAIDFASQPAGDYTITVTAVASNQANNSEAAVRSYKNKALTRVSLFSVIEPSTLLFNAVENAERYLITVDCGNDSHNHTDFDNGNSTNFNFANCPMQEGGIIFTVTAVADGYASSTSEKYVYDRMLGKVTGMSLDEDTQMLVWDAVPNAASYIVSVNGGEGVNNGNKTSFSLKTYGAGAMTVKVTPVTKGYNSPEASEYKYTKKALASPDDIRIVGETLSWTGDEKATSYEVKIGGKTFKTNETSLNLAEIDDQISWVVASDYKLSVRAIGSTNSPWSDELDIRYYAMYSTLTYAQSEVSWRHVVGALVYEVKVNNGVAITVEDGSNSAEVTLTKAGNNTISVRFFDGNEYSDWATIDVYAHTVTFDSRSGEGVAPQYKAVGDKIELPETTLSGYDFAGWYNAPGGAAGNGAQYSYTIFNEAGDLVLYANWKPAVYTITYDYGVGTGVDNIASVAYKQNYTLEVPTIDDLTMCFVGWYGEADGKGVQYTNEKGESLSAWMVSGDITLHAYWKSVFEYTYSASAKGYYVKSSGLSSLNLTSVTIPATYNDGVNGEAWVVGIDTAAFSYCKNLKEVTLPDTLKSVSDSAFNSCSNLMNVYVANSGLNVEPVYYDIDGVLVFIDTVEAGTPHVLAYFPLGRTGEIVIPEGITYIPTKAFYYALMTKVTIPASVTRIPTEAFYRCSELTEVIFAPGGDATLEIADSAFYYSAALEKITYPARLAEFNTLMFKSCPLVSEINVEAGGAFTTKDGMLCDSNGTTIIYCPVGRTQPVSFPIGITTIGDGAFINCINLTEVVIPNYITKIGNEAFYGCKGITKVTFEGGAAISQLTVGNKAFYGCEALENVIFEDGSKVVSIGVSAFAGCKMLTEINLPASLVTLSDYAFTSLNESTGVVSGNSYLTKVTFAENGKLETIGAYAFYKCTKITEISFPASLKMIGTSAFDGCTVLASVTFAESDVELKIGDCAFQNCTALLSFDIPANLTSIGSGAFNGCKKLASLNVLEGNEYYITVDGVLFNKGMTEMIFYPAGKTDSFKLPDTVTKIGIGLFSGNTSLPSITIGKNVTEIGAMAFYNCTNLKEVIFEEGDTELVLGHGQNGLVGSIRGVFQSCTALETVQLSSRIKEIPDFMFSGCTALKEIELPSTISRIGHFAFYGSGLEEIVIPNSVESIGACAFYGSYSSASLETVIFEEGGDKPLVFEEWKVNNSTESSETFGYQKKLTTVVLPERLTYISFRAFYDCTSLTEITIPKGVTFINYGAFEGCTALTNVTFEPGGTAPLTFGTSSTYGVFSGCSALGSIILPDRLVEIPAYCFYNCSSLTSVSFEFAEANKDTRPTEFTVDSTAFNSSLNLIEVTFPATLVDFNTSTLSQQLKLTAINVEAGGANYCSADGILYNADKTEIVMCPKGMTGIVTIPNTITFIGNDAFYKCANITEIIFAPGGTQPLEIEDGKYSGVNLTTSAFGSCTSLTTITLPARLSVIGTASFWGCSALTSVTFENDSKLEEIHDFAFKGTAFTELDVPATVKTIGSSVFDSAKIEKISIPSSLKELGATFTNCKTIKEINFKSSANENFTAKDGVVLGDNGKTLSYYPIGKTDTNYTVPDGVTTITANAFRGNPYIRTVTIPASVTLIDYGAFAQCTALKEIIFAPGGTTALTLGMGNGYNTTSSQLGVFYGCTELSKVSFPARLASLGAYAFYNCSSLREVTFDKGCSIPTIGKYTFYGCSSLNAMAIPATVGTIDENAFYKCSSLKTVTFEEGSVLELIGRPGTSTTSSVYVFYQCASLEKIILPESFRTFNGVSIFSGCTSLKEVYIPEGVEELDSSLFYGCSSLEKITVPSTVKKIGNSVFYGCSSLTEMTLPALITELGTNTFDGCNKLSKITLLGAITKIGNYSFRGTAITEFVIPSTVTTLGTYVFQNCTSLKKVSIPTDSFTTVDDYTFDGCTALTEVIFVGNGSKLTTFDTGAFRYVGLTSFEVPSYIKTIGKAAFACSALENLTFASSSNELTLTAGSYSITSTLSTAPNSFGAFAGCAKLAEVDLTGRKIKLNSYAFEGSALTSVNVPSTVTTLGSYVFQNCTKLTKATINTDTVSTTGTYAFANCAKLTEVIFDGSGNKLVTIGNYAFKGTGLTSFEVPSFITTIGTGAFAESELTTLTFAEGTKALAITAGTTATSGAFAGCESLSSISFSSRLSVISNYTFYGCTALTSVTFPDSLTKIGNYAFTYSGVEGVTFTPKANGAFAFTEIGENAFQHSAIKSISLPSSVTIVRKYAFDSCEELTTVKFENDANGDASLEWVGYTGYSADNQYASYVFANCPKLTDVTLPSSALNISDSAFVNSGLKRIVLPDSVLHIGSYAFYNCSELKDVYMPRTVEVLNPYAFAGCGFEVLPDLPTNMDYIASYVFAANNNLTKITIPGHMKNVNAAAFAECVNLTEVIVEEGVTTLSDYVFYGCTSLTKVSLPSSLATVELNPFAGCTSLTDFVLASKNADFSVSDGVLYSGDGLTLVCYPAGRAGTFYIPQRVTAVQDAAFEGSLVNKVVVQDADILIGNYAFADCAALESIEIPEGLTTMGDLVFIGCASLPEITVISAETSRVYTYKNGVIDKIVLPEGVTVIEANEFEGSTALTVVMPQGVTEIGDNAFKNSSIKSIVIPKTVTKLGKNAFTGCNSLEEVIFEEGGEDELIVSGVLATNSPFANLPALKTVVLPARLVTIPNYMFDGCSALESVTLPEEITTIGQYTFRNTGFKSYEVPAHITVIDTAAFNGSAIERLTFAPRTEALSIKNGSTNLTGVFAQCTSLKEVVFDVNANVANYLFYGCTSLENVTLPEGITAVGTYVFYGCTALSTVKLPTTLTSLGGNSFRSSGLESIEIPEGITDILTYTFYECTELKSVKLPEYMNDIATYAFQYSGLESIVIPEGVKIIHLYTLANCKNLKSVTLPSTLTTIHNNGFNGSTAIKEIVIPVSVVDVSAQSFGGWTKDQKIILEGRSSYPGTWATFENCEATLVYLGEDD